MGKNINFVNCAKDKMQGVVQIHVEGQNEDDPRSVLQPEYSSMTRWSGSGFFVKLESNQEGYILTNAHVVRNATTIQIMSMLTSGERFSVEIVGIVKDLEPDVALLKLGKSELKRFNKCASKEITYLELANNYDVMRGTEVKAIGYPLGMAEPNITTGDITNFVSSSRDTVEKYVTDAAINPGNSGGPALVETGEVIGLNTAIYSGAENIGFLTPFSFTQIVLKNLLNQGGACFSDLGGIVQTNSRPLARYLKQTGEVRGVVVARVEKNGFFDLLEIKENDIVLSINGYAFDRHGQILDSDTAHHKNIFDVIKLIPIGEIIEIELLRSGTVIHLSAPAVARVLDGIKSVPLFKDRVSLNIFGMTIQELDIEIINAFREINLDVHYELIHYMDLERTALVVTHIDLNGEADQQEWYVGEVIESVNGVEVTKINQLRKMLKNSKGKQQYFIKCKSGIAGVFKR